MKENILNQLQIREIFHLEFLRWLGRKVKSSQFVLKGGSNLRFFFNSIRYSEDMDLDVQNTEVHKLCDIVLEILDSISFKNILKPFGIFDVIPPSISSQKQTETTQRFKIHLITAANEDLFTKIEFSRRGITGNAVIQSVSDVIIRNYKLLPILIPHYDIQTAIVQKINALASRAITQARDIFDIYILSPQCGNFDSDKAGSLISKSKIENAYENVFKISYDEFRSVVVSYFSIDDRKVYDNVDSWEEVKLKTAEFIEILKNKVVG